MSDDEEGRSCNKRRERDHEYRSPPRKRVHGDREGLHPAERKRRHHLRAYFKMIHEVRFEVQHFESFVHDAERELRNEFSDVSAAHMIEKTKLFLHRLSHFGHCPLSGDAINEMTYINHCGHVFNKISLEQANPKVDKCHICSKSIGYPFLSG